MEREETVALLLWRGESIHRGLTAGTQTGSDDVTLSLSWNSHSNWVSTSPLHPPTHLPIQPATHPLGPSVAVATEAARHAEMEAGRGESAQNRKVAIDSSTSLSCTTASCSITNQTHSITFCFLRGRKVLLICVC